MTEPMVDDALVEKVARAMVARRYPRLTDAERDEMWDAWVGDAQSAIAIAYPAGVAAGREEAATHLEAEAASYRHAQNNANSPGDKLYRMGQKDACLLEATAIRQRGE